MERIIKLQSAYKGYNYRKNSNKLETKPEENDKKSKDLMDQNNEDIEFYKQTQNLPNDKEVDLDLEGEMNDMDPEAGNLRAGKSKKKGAQHNVDEEEEERKRQEEEEKKRLEEEERKRQEEEERRKQEEEEERRRQEEEERRRQEEEERERLEEEMKRKEEEERLKQEEEERLKKEEEEKRDEELDAFQNQMEEEKENYGRRKINLTIGDKDGARFAKMLQDNKNFVPTGSCKNKGRLLQSSVMSDKGQATRGKLPTVAKSQMNVQSIKFKRGFSPEETKITMSSKKGGIGGKTRSPVSPEKNLYDDEF